MYEHGYAVDSTRFNQVDRRKNGVINFKPSEHSATTGPLAVTEGSSTSAIELDYQGGTVRVDQEPVDVTPGTVGLAPSDPNNPRKDLIYAAENGTVQALTGQPADNKIVDMNGELYAPLARKCPSLNPIPRLD